MNMIDHITLRVSNIEKAQPLLDTDYNHDAWFFGSDNEGIHKWTGYTLGYHIAKKYIEKSGKKGSELFDIDPKEVRKIIKL